MSSRVNAGVCTAVCALLTATVVCASDAGALSLLTRVNPSADVPTVAEALRSANAKAPEAVGVVEFRQRHMRAIDRALAGDTAGALKQLRGLTTLAGTQPDELDRVYLSIGRVDYQLGDDKGALDAYRHVRPGSSSWLEVLEERSWVYMREGQPEMALASLKTVLSPLYANRIRTEPYFLTALAQLRVCDYRSLFKTIAFFKNRLKPKVKAWEADAGTAGANSLQARVDAKARLDEVSDTIQKMNLVEAEAIQRLYLDDSGKPMKGSVPPIAHNRDQMSFPDTGGDEIWLDEVDDYHVRVKGCPSAPVEKVAAKEKSS